MRAEEYWGSCKVRSAKSCKVRPAARLRRLQEPDACKARPASGDDEIGPEPASGRSSSRGALGARSPRQTGLLLSRGVAASACVRRAPHSK